MKELDVDENWEKREIKSAPLTANELDQLRALTDSYESLFSRRSRQFKILGLGDRILSEDDYRDLILKEYTFLKRPVVLIEERIFIGNSKDTIAAARKYLNEVTG